MVKMEASEELVAMLHQMDVNTQRLLACDCAENVLHIFEDVIQNDPRPRNAIDVARRFATGEATDEQLREAGGKAEAAAWDAAALENDESPNKVQASSSAAVAAEATTTFEPIHAAIEAINMALETVLVAAIGSATADEVWRTKGDWSSIKRELAPIGQAALQAESDWQLQRAKAYFKM